MKIEKQELKNRIFIPYTITITIDNEKEHDNLKDDLRILEEYMRTSRSYISRIFKEPAIEKLVEIIRYHVK